ncbi:hypothetical protein CVT26_013423, partial [Gymnopilus dilepis]
LQTPDDRYQAQRNSNTGIHDAILIGSIRRSDKSGKTPGWDADWMGGQSIQCIDNQFSNRTTTFSSREDAYYRKRFRQIDVTGLDKQQDKLWTNRAAMPPSNWTYKSMTSRPE